LVRSHLSRFPYGWQEISAGNRSVEATILSVSDLVALNPFFKEQMAEEGY
jgi:hypothetical protein